jgi:thiamine phosphate synthase YjbQ (UPF0047 family)
MTSIEVPYSIAAVLPTLTVMDITNDVTRELANHERPEGIAYVSSGPGPSIVRVNERETGFFEDLECLLERLVPLEREQRDRHVQMLLGPRSEQIPFKDGALCLGTWQRILLVAFGGHHSRDWTLTVVG